MPKYLIVDANFVLALNGGEKYSDKASEIYKLVQTKKVFAFAPTFLLVEVLNILIKKKKIDPEEVKNSINRLKKSEINFIDTDFFIKNTPNLEDLVIKYNITSYDGLYILLAIQKKCKLLTADQELLKIKNLTVDLKSFE